MKKLSYLFEQNKQWASSINEKNPDFFKKLSMQQSPEYMWIGCSDSRVPANDIVNLMPGELFVHRNIANVVIHTDLNCLSVAQFAVDVLKVKHIIVCGHYGCGGVHAALQNSRLGLCDNWIQHVKDVKEKHSAILAQFTDEKLKLDKLCELNVIEQVLNVCETSIVQDAWELGQELSVHGWIYGIDNGLLNDLNVCVSNPDELLITYNEAVKLIETGDK
jgi:carbonic anhydrase